jgi:hypothetical protein
MNRIAATFPLALGFLLFRIFSFHLIQGRGASPLTASRHGPRVHNLTMNCLIR